MDETDVYWVDGGPKEAGAGSGRIMKIAKAGGAMRLVASGLHEPRAIQVDRTHVYWTSADGMIMRVAKAGAAPTLFQSGFDGYLSQFIIDDRFVYWCEETTSEEWKTKKDAVGYKLVRKLKEGGDPDVIADLTSYPTALAVDATDIYWIDPDHRVMTVPKNGGKPRVLAIDQLMPYGVGVDANYVYWSTWSIEDKDDKRPPGAILRVAKHGGEPEYLARRGAPESLAVGQRDVFWLDTVPLKEAVRRVSKTGGWIHSPASNGLGQELGLLVGLVVDGMHVYWISRYGSEGRLDRARY
jgi:hypothetical protein